jgi:hypothetical protein
VGIRKPTKELLQAIRNRGLTDLGMAHRYVFMSAVSMIKLRDSDRVMKVIGTIEHVGDSV